MVVTKVKFFLVLVIYTDPPLVFPSPPEGFLEVVLGEMVEIGCSSVGVPPPTITWRTKVSLIYLFLVLVQLT